MLSPGPHSPKRVPWLQEEPQLEVFAKFLSEEWPLPVAAAYASARLLAASVIQGTTYLEYPADRQALPPFV